MMYVFIDCGSTATRWYLICNDNMAGVYTDKRGINSVSGREEFKKLLMEQYEAFLQDQNISGDDIEYLMAAGMITSNLGLKEVPHQIAPAGLPELWDTMDILKVGEESPFAKPLYLIRGIKNPGTPENFADLTESDLMRGEELQTMGVVEMYPPNGKPMCIIELGSTSKLILVNEKQEITGSYTALSGQTYQAISQGTFIGNSISKRGDVERPEGYYDEKIVEEAMKCEDEAGFLRSIMLVRFSDVLMKKEWYERELFYSALFTATDRKWLKAQLSRIDAPEIYLVGQGRRCKIYEQVLRQMEKDGDISIGGITMISDPKQVEQLAVRGAILLIRSHS